MNVESADLQSPLAKKLATAKWYKPVAPKVDVSRSEESWMFVPTKGRN
jgi:hypothetical protein